MISCERRGDDVVVKLIDLHGNIEYLDAPKPDDGLKNIACAFAEYRLRGREMPAITQLSNNLKTMAILDAGLRAARSGRTELVDNAAWGINR